MLLAAPHNEGLRRFLWTLAEAAKMEVLWREMPQWERSKERLGGKLSTEWSLVLDFGKNVNRMPCQDLSHPGFSLHFQAWHMNFSNDMTSARKKKSSHFTFILLTEGSRGRQQEGGNKTTNRVSKKSILVPFENECHMRSSFRELKWRHLWMDGSLQFHKMGSVVRPLQSTDGNRHWHLKD